MMALYATASTAVDASAWASVMDALTAQVNVANIIGVLTTLVTAGIGIVFMWWGVRKTVKSLMTAFRKGRISIG